MKSTFLITLLLAISLRMYAPNHVEVYIVMQEKINPYEPIWRAVCKYESKNDSSAFCVDVNGLPSIGVAQIQQSRLSDYNAQSGHNYHLSDMFSPVRSRELFMWFASRSKNIDKFIRSWNGSGDATVIYLQNIKKLL
jgi:hypothetical protein